MKPRGIALLASLALVLAAAGRPQTGAANPAAADRSRTAGAPRAAIEGVPDTGQFLPDTALLGRVNGKPLTVREFVESYYNAYAPDRPSTDSAGRVEWLNSMVNKEILARVAHHVNYQPDFAERATLRAYEQRVLSNTLFQRRVLDSIRVTDAEVDEVTRGMSSEYRLQHIQCPSRSTADSAYQAVRAGMRWIDAVKRFSTAANDSGPEGDLGWSTLLPASADMTFEVLGLKPGAIGPPVGDRDGWHVMRVVATRPGVPFQDAIVRRSAVAKCRARSAARLSDALTERMRQTAHITYDEDNIRWACRKFPAPQSMSEEGGMPTMHFSALLPEFSPQDTGRVVARSADGALSLTRFESELGQFSPLRRPPVDTPEDFKSEIDRIVLEPYRATLARELGLDKDPMAVAMMAKRVEQMQVEHLYQDSIEARVRVTPTEVRRYYQAHPADFMTFPKARYAMFIVPDKGQADSMTALLKGVTQVDAMVESFPRHDGHKMAMIKDEKDEDHGTYHTLLYGELKPGQSYVDGPDKQGQFAVIHLVAFDPGHLLPFEQARGYADEQVRARNSEAMLNALIKRHRKGMQITVHPELVTRVRMLDPATTPD